MKSEPIKCIAVDDEPIALDIISSHAQKVPYLNLLAGFNSATEALAFIKITPVDLVFLDIQMPDMSGLEMAKLINNQIPLIFTTAYSDFAVQGFDLAAVDYLLKPINYSRFFQACEKVYEKINSVRNQRVQNANIPVKYLFVKNGYEWERVNLDELLFIETADNYLTFHEASKRTITRMTLVEALNKLPNGQYVQIHKSYAVALAQIDKVERHQLIVGGRNVPLSANFRSNILRIIETQDLGRSLD